MVSDTIEAVCVCVGSGCRHSIMSAETTTGERVCEVRVLCMECHSWFTCQKLFGCVYPVCVCDDIAGSSSVKLVVFFQAKGRISGVCVCVCVGVPSSPHVSSADPVQELHADQCVCVCVLLQKGPVCSDVPAAPHPGVKSLHKVWEDRKNKVSLSQKTHTLPLKLTLLQTSVKKKNGLNRDGLALLSVLTERQRERGVWVGSPLTLSPTDSYSHYSTSASPSL